LENINEIHENVFDLLESYQSDFDEKSRKQFFTLRKTNQKSRLEKGYWFHGNDYYIAVSFWSGMDWKNKTPNIFFRITTEGRSFLTFTCKDSTRKAEICRLLFLDKLDLLADGTDRWSKEYKFSDYMQSLEHFLGNDKRIIDDIIVDNPTQVLSEDAGNSIGFINEDLFKKWLSKIYKYRNENFGTSLPFSLTAFNVENYVPIKKASFGQLPNNIPFIFLVGDNGSGKSSILKALAITLGNKYIEDSHFADSPWHIKFSINIGGRSFRGRIHRDATESKILSRIPFAGYGPSRLIIDNRSIRSTVNEIGRDRTAPLWSIFYPDAVLRDINRWIINQISTNNSDEQGKANARMRFDNIKLMLVSVIPNIFDIREVPWDDTQELLYFEEDLQGNKAEKGLIFEHLSSGIRSLIAMIGDMMLRLFEQQPEIYDPAELAGVVLIDEIDLHLHPKWQKKVPEILNENFPKVQFIASTHSPIPLIGAPKNSRIYLVSRDFEKGISLERMDDKVMFSQILPNAILTSPIFGLDDITPVSKDENKQTIVEDNFDNISFYDKLEKDVNKYLTNDRQKELINLFRKEK
jgi:predicted ATPase